MMICVSVMLAVFLGWPLAFGGGSGSNAGAEQRAVVSVPVAKPKPAQQGTTRLASVEMTAPAESCYKRYQREIKQCADGSAACRLKSADNWDLCEATGFWPD